ncbi:tRNA-dihydrouridine(20a/20b) synthase [NADP(+)] [Anaeramoeba flamelloides]|uniref:tRNA-dihydrouridine(20a/20b) synthase [NADP(+)] n=1 Tax=Anaeramoeba flamelloides TaxID=1746091 RepID=A0ABQ8Y6C6_9EUKA|nr:tRNA-dihydrouridine(20a/20b) synthase [NADP(+)] [Anaeramoeba flamelloides]
MIVAQAYNYSKKVRSIELDTDPNEQPMVVQFASSNAEEFSSATEHVLNICNGVNLNCGCPKSHITKLGCGSALLRSPEKIADIVKTAKSRFGEKQGFSISTKIRLLPSKEKTIELCRRIEKMNTDFLIIHARTKHQKDSETPNYEMMGLIRDTIQIPIVANGSIFCKQDYEKYLEVGHFEGVMSARGLVRNPGLFEGSTSSKAEYVKELWDYTNQYKWPGYKFITFRKMFGHVTHDLLSKQERILLQKCKTEETLEKVLLKNNLLDEN